MVYHIGKFAIAVMAVCFLQTSALAGSTNQVKVGLVITDQNDASNGNNNNSAKYTCNAARTKITMSGYKSVEVLECEGNVYQFSGQSNLKILNISFNPFTGQISII